MTTLIVTAQFLRDREHAGVNRELLKALFPPHVWPAEWADDPKSTTNEEDDS